MTDMQSKKRFMRDKLHISTKNLSNKEVNTFFKRIDTIKKKHS